MLDIISFSNCIRKNLKDRRYGKERADEIIKDFENRAAAYAADGKTTADAGALAARDIFDNLSLEKTEKLKRTAATLAAHVDGLDRIRSGIDEINTALFGGDAKGRGSRGKAAIVALKSMLSPDPRAAKGFNVFTLTENLMKTAMAVWDNETGRLDTILVGALGRQKGKAHLDNMIYEAFGKKSGDDSARELMQGWKKANEYQLQEFRAAGGSIRELENYIPQPKLNRAKMARNEDQFVKDYAQAIDWSRTRRPDGSLIPESEREDFAREAFTTQVFDGANKIDVMQQRGSGSAKGNRMDRNRVVHIKDADSWLKLHSTYGDGTIYDVLQSHMADLAHATAMVKVLGPNPDMMIKTLTRAAEKILQSEKKVSAREVAIYNGKAKEVQELYEIVARKNPLNTESVKAHAFLTAQNLTTAAFLQASSIVSAVTDPIVTGLQKAWTGSSMQAGFGLYAKAAVLSPNEMRKIALRSGFIYDSSINHQYATMRFEQNLSAGQHVSRRVADVVLRANGMTHFTNAAQVRTIGERMAFMAETLNIPFEKHKLKPLFEKYGISASEWDGLRGMAAFEPQKGVKLLRPLDVMKRGGAGDADLSKKLMHMLTEDSRMGVVMSTPEAAATLRGATRPDTWSGLILANWSMFKSFPLQYFNNIMRHAMTIDSQAGRMGYLASTLAATTLAGYAATQLGQIKDGRTPAQLVGDDGSVNEMLIVKSMLKGGGLGFVGDIVAGVAEDRSLEGFLAGPPASLLAEGGFSLLANPALEFYKAAEGDITYEEAADKSAAQVVRFARRYIPGQRLPYTDQLLSHMFWNRLERSFDPKWEDKVRRRDNNLRELYGNKYYFDPRDSEPDFSKFTEE